MAEALPVVSWRPQGPKLSGEGGLGRGEALPEGCLIVVPPSVRAAGLCSVVLGQLPLVRGSPAVPENLHVCGTELYCFLRLCLVVLRNCKHRIPSALENEFPNISVAVVRNFTGTVKARLCFLLLLECSWEHGSKDDDWQLSRHKKSRKKTKKTQLLRPLRRSAAPM